MDIIISILFIMCMFVFNFNILNPILAIKDDDAKQTAGFMVLCGFNVLAATGIVLLLHPHMSDNLPALAFCGFIAGAVIFAVSTIPFAKK